jgi:polysaccharide export outer membrane protein
MPARQVSIIQTPSSHLLQLNAVISPQDKLEVNVFNVPELSAKDVLVEPNGMVSLPYIGRVNLRGLTLQQAEKRVEHLLSKDLQHPKVNIKRTQQAIRRITVEGAVQTPGVFPITGSMTFLQAIAMSQGITEVADTTEVVVFRDGKQYSVNLHNVRRGLSPDPMLQQNDRIVVLQSNRKVTEKKVLEYLPAILAPLSLIM